MHRLTGI